MQATKRIISVLCCVIPIRRLRRRVREALTRTVNRLACQKYHRRNEVLENALRKKVAEGHRVRVAFLVTYDSVFPGKTLFEEMTKDVFFDPFIVIIPDFVRGAENTRRSMYKSFALLNRKYPGRVTASYCSDTRQFADIRSRCDLCIPAYPYSDMTHPFYTTEYLQDHGVLSFYINYGYGIDRFFSKYVVCKPALNRLWRFFCETRETYETCRSWGRCAVLSGYSKMDALARVVRRPRTRKCIILAPHHTIASSALPLSHFLSYADFFLELPSLYPEVDWVFRPHPLLYTTLCSDKVWGKVRTDAYFRAVRNHPNCIWQDGGDYFDTFVNSDAMIHDCCSFAAEYLFTGHPGCFLLRDEQEIPALFNKTGQACISLHYKAFNRQQIRNFIDTVVLRGEDTLQVARTAFVRDSLMFRYPRVTQYILHSIKAALLPA